MLWAVFHFGEAILLSRRLEKDGITRLHNHFANSAATVGLLSSHFLRLPWSLTLHGISEFDYPAGYLLAAKLEKADFAACVSYFGMAQAMRITHRSIWPKLNLVRCGVDPADFPEISPTTESGEAVRIICVGRLSPEKGHAGLIAAFGNLLKRGFSAQLALVGDGPEDNALREQVKDGRLEDRIIFAGRLDEGDTLRAIAGSDILVLASFMEGLPIVLMEAMTLGVPVIASAVAGIPELVADEETGLLFTPADWAGLEEALARLCADSRLRHRLAERGMARVADGFHYPSAAKPLEKLFAGR